MPLVVVLKVQLYKACIHCMISEVRSALSATPPHCFIKHKGKFSLIMSYVCCSMVSVMNNVKTHYNIYNIVMIVVYHACSSTLVKEKTPLPSPPSPISENLSHSVSYVTHSVCYSISTTVLITWRLLNMPSSKRIDTMLCFFINSESYILNCLIIAYGHALIFDKYFHLSW